LKSKRMEKITNHFSFFFFVLKNLLFHVVLFCLGMDSSRVAFSFFWFALIGP
jgi:hypothetical protein